VPSTTTKEEITTEKTGNIKLTNVLTEL